MAEFRFLFERPYKVLGLPFGVSQHTSAVIVDRSHLQARFGPWVLRTPLDNVVGWQRSGPFRLIKTAGPAHMSVADRGLTFATNRSAGICVRFAEPVPCFDPFGLVRHPAVTLTLEALDDFERALAEGADGRGAERLSEGMSTESPWAVLRRWTRWPAGMAVAGVRYLRARSAVRRTSELRQGPPPALATHDLAGVQRIEDGTGPVVECTYQLRISGSSLAPHELLDAVLGRLDQASPTEVAGFAHDGEMCAGVERGFEFVIRMPGPWRNRVRVVARSPAAVVLATLPGHLEAGSIEFCVKEGRDSALEFEIRSVARSRSRVVSFFYNTLPVIREMQLYMWVHFCQRVAVLSGGTATGEVALQTVRYDDTPAHGKGLGGRHPDRDRVKRELDELHGKDLNFDPTAQEEVTPENGWRIDDYCVRLPPEAPGSAVRGGSWETARRLMADYEFADPSIVRAVYHPDQPLEDRTMLLEARFYWMRFLLGVRVGGVIDQVRTVEERPVRVWGWNYRTLQGHLEMGQMDYEVWKWMDTGDVEFRIHAFSKAGIIPNPVIRLGFAVFGRHMQKKFARRALTRMQSLVSAELVADATHRKPARGPARTVEHLEVRSALPRK